MPAAKEALKEEARESLSFLKPNDTIYWVSRRDTDSNHYSDFYVAVMADRRVFTKANGWNTEGQEPGIRRITLDVCNLLGYGWDKRRQCFKGTYAEQLIAHLAFALFGHDGGKFKTVEL